jgi:hypothetical protein
MRIIAGIVLAIAGLLFSYWALTMGTHDPIEWVFVTAFVWLMCHDVWQRFFNRTQAQTPGVLRSSPPLRRPHPRP